MVAFQFDVLKRSIFGVGTSLLVYNLASRVKKLGMLGVPLYIMAPFAVWMNVKYKCFMRSVFELGYPAHPDIIEKRRKFVNESCFFAPSTLKNEIEYMHSKIDGVKSEDDLAEKIKAEEK